MHGVNLLFYLLIVKCLQEFFVCIFILCNFLVVWVSAYNHIMWKFSGFFPPLSVPL